jgi:hypothetical protein
MSGHSQCPGQPSIPQRLESSVCTQLIARYCALLHIKKTGRLQLHACESPIPIDVQGHCSWYAVSEQAQAASTVIDYDRYQNYWPNSDFCNEGWGKDPFVLVAL